MKPASNHVGPMLTDLYEITMASAYFRSGKHNDRAVFDLFFRKNPFGGEFTVAAGIAEILAFVENFRYSGSDIAFLEKTLPRWSPEFGKWLRQIDCSEVRIHAVPEGSLVFPRVPLIRVEGPLGICQLLESTLLNLIGYPSLVATNAARLKLAAGSKRVVEFGLRRAQGPDGGLSASRYAYLGGLDGTSNVLAGQMFGIPLAGTQAHAYVSAFSDLDEITYGTLADTDGRERDFVGLVMKYRDRLGYGNTNNGELASFITYAQAFPSGFLALVDTYDTLGSGVPNFLCVAFALLELGYKPKGIRLDSGDLAHLSKRSRRMFKDAEKKTGVNFERLTIVASNEINEATLYSLNLQGHEIDLFGIGTHLVTCQSQPSLGVVYKLVEINGRPRIKLSEDSSKVTIPGRKKACRLIGRKGYPVADLMLGEDEPLPQAGRRVLCCHPYDRAKRSWVTPADVVPLHELIWDGKLVGEPASLDDARRRVGEQIGSLREDHKRPLNPTPYKVSLSENLFEFMQKLWMESAVVREIS